MPLTAPPSLDTDTTRPEDYGIKAWNWDPYFSSGSNTTKLNTAGRLNAWLVPIRYPITVSNIHLMVTTAGAGLTSTSCGVALYNATTLAVMGSLVTGVATAWGTAGFKTHTVSGAPFNLLANSYVYVAAWFNGTTAPALLAGPITGTEYFINETASNARAVLANSTVTTAAPTPMASRAGTGLVPFWVGLS